MITFQNLGLHGRLGNQLFQYAALRGITEKNNYVCKIPDFSASSWHGQKCLLSNFNLKAEIMSPIDRFRSMGRVVVEKDFNKFDPSFFQIEDDVSIHGFFQSINYFKHCEDTIKQEFIPKDEFLIPCQDKVNYYKNQGFEVVSIHIRRGDMMDYLFYDTGIHPDTFFSPDDIFDNSTIFGDYLNKCFKLFENKKVKYFVFAGGKRTGDDSDDINYIKKMFQGDQFVISETNDPMLDFTTIMCCDHNITCHQSTFGWWAAYLNPNPDKIVTSPEKYFFIFSDELNQQRIENGHFPHDWTIIK
jgi:hypothetical protein